MIRASDTDFAFAITSIGSLKGPKLRIEAMSTLRKVQNFETVAPTAPTTRLVAQPETQPSHDEDEATQSHGRSI